MTRPPCALRGPVGLAAAVVLLAACAAAPSSDGPVVRTPAVSASSSASRPTAGVTTSSPSPTASASAATPTTFTVVAGGDVLLHPPTWEQADADAGAVGDGTLDFTPMLAGIEPVVSAADLALCHLETPLAPPEGPFAGYPAFAVPPQIVGALARTGFDACSAASNHTFDVGLSGVERTVAAMRAGGVPTYGIAAGSQPPNPSLLTAGGLTIGLLSYTYGSNGAVPESGVVEQIDVADIAADAAAARAAGAQIVVASVHWGTEYDHQPDARQREVAPQLAAIEELDLVIGHHAHVVQPIERVDGTWVAYGLGNMLATQATDVPANHEGVLARFTFTLEGARWRVTEAGYLPLLVEREPAVRLVALTEPGPTARHAEALARTRDVVRRGAAGDELVELPPM